MSEMVWSPWVLKVLADIPALVGSAAVVVLVSALPPPPGAAAVVVGGLPVVLLLLCAGRGGPLAVRLLYRGRAARPFESESLAPALVLLCAHGLGPPDINLYIRDRTDDHAAQDAIRTRIQHLGPAHPDVLKAPVAAVAGSRPQSR